MTYRNSVVSLFALIALLIVLPLLAIACEPPLIIEVENQTDQTLIIYNFGRQIGEVAPGKIAKMDAGADIGAVIEARNSEGELVYSKKFTPLELSDIGDKIVISPSSE